MANHKSAIKRHRQSIKRNARNNSFRAELWTLTKKFVAAPKKEALEIFKALQAKIDQAGRKGLMQRNKAARKVSRMQKQLMAK
jgi:small subunit ribosomal protein S20